MPIVTAIANIFSKHVVYCMMSVLLFPTEASPLAKFIHANLTSDLMKADLERHSTVVLVDSVVNSGKTMGEFVQHVCNIHEMFRIVFLVGVICSKTISS
jgi:hypoxanthine phosphoribosyltransferase